MAYKEVSRVEVTEIIRQWQAKRGIRQISRSTGLARNTIRKHLLAAQSCGLERDGPPPTESQLVTLVNLNKAGPHRVTVPTDELLGSWAGRIEHWLKEDKLKLTRVQELLAGKGCLVPYMSLRRFVTRKGWSKGPKATVRMADTAPGEIAEADFGRLGLIWDAASSRQRLAWGMSIVLGYSRHQFVWPLFSQQLGDVIEGMEAAWAFFGGLPRFVVIDNFPAAVIGPDPYNPRLTRGFLEYAQHRGFIPDTARPGHAKDKPKVERQVPYIRERFFKGGQFHDLKDLREQAGQWCLNTAGQRVHGTTRRQPLVVFNEEERTTLLPYDGEPYDMPVWRYGAVVHQDHHIYYRYGLYSAPSSTCPPGTKLDVRGDSKLVKLYKQAELVKVHPRKPRGGRSTDPEDYPPELTPYTLRSSNYLKAQCRKLGEPAGDFADKLLSGPLPWAKLRQAHKLLRLGEKYTPDRLNAACEKAISVDLIDVRRLENILAEALEGEIAAPVISSPAPAARFARPGHVFAISNNNNGGNHRGN